MEAVLQADEQAGQFLEEPPSGLPANLLMAKTDMLCWAWFKKVPLRDSEGNKRVRFERIPFVGAYEYLKKLECTLE